MTKDLENATTVSSKRGSRTGRYRRQSVAMVVAATLVCVTTALLLALGALSYASKSQEEWSLLRHALSVQAAQLAVGLALPVWNIDRSQIDKIIEGLEDMPAIAAVVVDAAGKRHASIRDSRGQLVPSDGRIPPGELLSEERPITFSGERIGTVRVFATPRYVRQTLHAELLNIVATILAIDILIILSVYYVLWRTVVRPLVDIERYAAVVSAGGGAAFQGPPFTAEVESLRRSIEGMVRLLDHRYDALQREVVRRAEMEEALRRSELMAALGSVVGAVAHEVRNPLFAISAMLDAYGDEMSHPDLEGFSEELRRQVSRLTQLMRELLEFGRPVAIVLAPGALAGVIAEAVAGRAQSAREAGVTLHVAVDEALPEIAMDGSRIRQVLENLIDNAIQHAPAVRIVTVAALVSGQGESRWVECRIEDDGPGFHPSDLALVFEPFFTRRERGTGLGLAIVRRIVEEHAGRVEAGNRPEGGAVVTVRLPVRVAEAHTTGRATLR
ncbi:MAG: histidine kinase [Acidobacteria bacterium]|nr:histidine kinase [Acidobacteriota bacterium]